MTIFLPSFLLVVSKDRRRSSWKLHSGERMRRPMRKPRRFSGNVMEHREDERCQVRDTPNRTCALLATGCCIIVCRISNYKDGFDPHNESCHSPTTSLRSNSRRAHQSGQVVSTKTAELRDSHSGLLRERTSIYTSY